MTTNQTERVSGEELDQMIWKLERDGMTPKMLSLMREVREVRRAKGQRAPVVGVIDETLIDGLRFVQCMLDDYRESNYGHAMDWVRHINTKMEEYSDKHGDDAYCVMRETMQLSGNSEQLEPVSNRDELPAKCWCQTCRPVTMNDMRFVVCPECGNKRCPRANDHRNACTGSNAPGQDGSAYPPAPNFRENVNSSTNNCREMTETSTNCPKCGGRGTYHCPQMLGTVECECTLPAAPKEVG